MATEWHFFLRPEDREEDGFVARRVVYRDGLVGDRLKEADGRCDVME